VSPGDFVTEGDVIVELENVLLMDGQVWKNDVPRVS